MNPKTNELIAAELAEHIRTGDSPFDEPGFNMPVNPTTGKAYRGMNALWLAMQGRQDPRWMTLKQASNKNGWKIATGSKGTLISFMKTTDRVTLLDENGRPQLNSRNNPKTELVKLTNPVETQAYVFNAEQIEDIPTLEEYLNDKAESQRLNPSEKLARLIELGELKVESTLGSPGYDASEAVIYMPEPENFETKEHHDATLLFEVVKAAGHAKGLYDPLDYSPAEEIRPALAALFLGSELGIESQLAAQLDLDLLLDVLDNTPEQLEAAANDAQYITDYVAGLDNQRGQGMRQERFLQVGDKIDYNERPYEVMGKLRDRALAVEDKSTGNRLKVSPGDGLYTSLLAAKNDALKQQRSEAQAAEQEQVLGPDAELDNSIAHEHADELERENTQGLDPDEDDDLELDLNLEEGENHNNSMKR